MATQLFLRNTTANTAGYSTSKKSVALPVGTFPGYTGAQDLTTVAGGAQVISNAPTLGQTSDQDIHVLKFISAPLLVSSISANTWTIAVCTSETNTNANAFTMCSIYVLTAGDTVRGFVYDSHTALGVEYLTTQDGQVLTVSGAAVSGVINTDRLAFEFWVHAVQGMATAYSVSLMFNGPTPVTDTTTTNAGSYIRTPQDLFVAPAQGSAPRPVLFPSLAVQQGTRW